MGLIKIMICDDDLISRIGISEVLSNAIRDGELYDPSIMQARDEVTLYAKLERLSGEELPDILILDLNWKMYKDNPKRGLVIAKKVKSIYPSIKIILKTAYEIYPPEYDGLGISAYIHAVNINKESIAALISEVITKNSELQSPKVADEQLFITVTRETAKGFSDKFLKKQGYDNVAMQKQQAIRHLMNVKKIVLEIYENSPESHFSKTFDGDVWDLNIHLLLLLLKGRDNEIRNYMEKTCNLRIEFL